ncbi:MAG: hypothetical protein FJX00_00275 [Alphaproteobacteria bacterium]|nr:hypothetical protein [Alphaproteobacteria bacterium]
MLNKIFISHWKITLMIFTAGAIALAVIAAMYWMPPMARLVEIPISVEQLTQGPKNSTPSSPAKPLAFHTKKGPSSQQP